MPPRLPPLPPGEWPAEMNDALAALRPANPTIPFPSRDPGRPKGLNILGTFARYPALAQAYNTFNGHVLFATSLSVRHRELIVLRVAAVRGCAYEWAQHVVLGRDAGLSDDEIARVVDEPATTAWSSQEAALLRAVDELIATATISDATWAALAEGLDDRQLMDVVFTVGAYDLLAMAMLAFGVEADDDLPDGNALLLKRDR